LAVACRRGRIMQLADGMGRMASLSLAPDEALPFLRPYGHRLSIGAINGPRSIVISGETAAVDSVVAQLAARGIEHRLLPVQYAFHSPQMAPLQRRLADELAGLRAGLPS